jgi:hypothetical protein
MTALLKLNEMRSIIKNGGICIKRRHFNKRGMKYNVGGKGGPGSSEMFLS